MILEDLYRGKYAPIESMTVHNDHDKLTQLQEAILTALPEDKKELVDATQDALWKWSWMKEKRLSRKEYVLVSGSCQRYRRYKHRREKNGKQTAIRHEAPNRGLILIVVMLFQRGKSVCRIH